MINLPESVERILVTGGSGFIGRNLIKRLLKETSSKVYNLDKVENKSVSLENKRFFASELISSARYSFYKNDLSDIDSTKFIINSIDPDVVFHLAAETHVDRSISSPKQFLESNVIGTFNLLETLMLHWEVLSIERKRNFRLIHVSTDEVFGSLAEEGYFSEASPYAPRSPYSATKAASDHLVMSWNHTYGLPVIVTNCSNNFGPWQLPEKFIPVIILNAYFNKPIPIYGDGLNVRDWIYVEDHIDALIQILIRGEVGTSYCIGGNQEKTNDEIVDLVCKLLDSFRKGNSPHIRLKNYVKDRLGHDKRYAIDNKKINQELKWSPKYDFQESLSFTVDWYLKNIDWCKNYIN